ncbi:MAG: hypothetical protein BGO69_15725 [Bacteroidetes bacterium 46-16]|nr:MAG: hypothetical protein BGO69_15725 [Bacteroidetes bacterium 46-16]
MHNNQTTTHQIIITGPVLDRFIKMDKLHNENPDWSMEQINEEVQNMANGVHRRKTTKEKLFIHLLKKHKLDTYELPFEEVMDIIGIDIQKYKKYEPLRKDFYEYADRQFNQILNDMRAAKK